MKYYKKIDGKNIYLASINLADAEKYMELVNNESHDGEIVFDGYKGEKIATIEEALEKLQEMADDNVFAIISKENDKLIGFTSLTNIQAMNQRSSMWIKIDTDIDFLNQVFFGAEAVDLLLDYAFNIMNLNNVVIDVPVFNRQALEICKHASMFFMAERHEACHYKDGKFYNLESFQCTKNMYGTKREVSTLEIDDSYIEYPYEMFQDKSMSDTVINDKSDIILSKYEKQKDYITRMASFLNNPVVSIPLGEYKVNWTDSSALEHLESVSYLIKSYEELIGYVNLFRRDSYNHRADLEIMIGDREFQNKGYGREALELFLSEIYVNSSYNALLSNIFDFNIASAKLHESLGYVKIGTRRESYYAYGKLNDMDIYEMNRTLYQKRMIK